MDRKEAAEGIDGDMKREYVVRASTVRLPVINGN